MNIFSNVGITEIVVILLLALLVVGPERLPEMGRKLAEILRDVRKAYENLTKDLGPEMQSIQRTTRELRESVESVRSIPKDMVKSVVDATELSDTIAELKEVTDGLEEVKRTAAGAVQVAKDPVGTLAKQGRDALLLAESDQEQEQGPGDTAPVPAATDESEGQESE